jgi:hypothetical protein
VGLPARSRAHIEGTVRGIFHSCNYTVGGQVDEAKLHGTRLSADIYLPIPGRYSIRASDEHPSLASKLIEHIPAEPADLSQAEVCLPAERLSSVSTH